MDALLHERMEDDGTLLSEVESTISEARADLKSMQSEDGHWVFDLEADATIPAEFILLNHYLDEIDEEIEEKLQSEIVPINEDNHE